MRWIFVFHSSYFKYKRLLVIGVILLSTLYTATSSSDIDDSTFSSTCSSTTSSSIISSEGSKTKTNNAHSIHRQYSVNNNLRTKPSRPPAPLYQGSGEETSITLHVHLNPNDAKKEYLLLNSKNELNPLPRYEFQSDYQNKNESSTTMFNGLWSDCIGGEFEPIYEQAHHFPPIGAAVTIPNLSFDNIYRFRVRVIYDNDNVSPWSSPSEVMETSSTVPHKPPTDIQVVSKTSTSITLAWKQNKESMAQHFNIQYRLQAIDEGGDMNSLTLKKVQSALKWQDYPDDIVAISRKPIPEVQEITTLVDEESMITKGYFWLKLRAVYDDPTLRSNIIESSTISKKIAFDASEENFEEAIRGIRGVNKVRVFRYKPGFWGTSDKPYHGTYSWRIEFEVIGHSSSLFEVHKENLDGSYISSRRCQVKRLVKGQPPSWKQDLKMMIGNLYSNKYYEFRLRGLNSFGNGNWKYISNVKTNVELTNKKKSIASLNQVKSNNVKLIAGKRRQAGNDVDPDYTPGAAMGGFDGEDGADGMVVIIQYDPNKLIIPSRVEHYFTGRPINYVVSGKNPISSEKKIDFVDLKLWGGGGAGGGTHRNYTENFEDGFSYGGGGGFVQTRIKVSKGDILTIKVGAGGKNLRLDEREIYPIKSGYLGGGQGGQSSMGQDAGSGGGCSIVSRDGIILAVAGGGGGGGTTNYCCAHGGEGGGKVGGNGISPTTPLFIGKDDGADGSIKNEFTPLDCDDDKCLDPRDKEGLPAFHTHLDRGFAPTAYYDNNSVGGLGGSQEFSGKPGNSSQYDVFDYHISTSALQGFNNIGGKGADGKEAGGGGGSGFKGGGGGGSGVDGSGGGGGSGYVDYSCVFIAKDASDMIQNELIGPTVTLKTHESIVLSWYSNPFNVDSKIGKRVLVFDIELSHGRYGAAAEGSKCSDEFKVVDRILETQGDPLRNTTIEGLESDTVYCFQIIAVGDFGSKRSSIMEVSTHVAPIDKWLQIIPREFPHTKTYQQKYDDIDESNRDHVYLESFCKVPDRPMARRGHSLTLLNGKIYLFGGAVKQCVCLPDQDLCENKSMYSNEVWSFSISTKTWTLLSGPTLDASHPVGREKHSATKLKNGKILIIGGRSDASLSRVMSKQPLILGDVWELDPGQIFSYTVHGLKSPQKILEGTVSYYSTQISIPNEPGYRDGQFCVRRVSTEIRIEHACVEQIAYIILSRLDGNSNDHYVSTIPANQAKLFVGSSTSSNYNSSCTSMISNITFSDKDGKSILDFSSKLPEKGTYKAAEPMRSYFENKLVNAQWILAIFDKSTDQNQGKLLDWKLHFDVDHCTEGIKWKKLSTNSNSCEETTIAHGKSKNINCFGECNRHDIIAETFLPRHSHTAIAIHNDVYVFGGNSHGIISEVWRFEYDKRLWVQLNANMRRRRFNGHISSLTPYGMITIGGIRHSVDNVFFTKNIFLYDVVKESETTMIVVDQNHTLSGYHPEDRTLFATCYIGEEHHLNDDIMPDQSAGLVILGGDTTLPHNSYLEDVWILMVAKLSFEKKNLMDLNLKRNTLCKDVLFPNRTLLNPWDWSCGSLAYVNSSNYCRWEDVVHRAWCLDQYQSFSSPI